MPRHELSDERFRELFGFDRLLPVGKPLRRLSPEELYGIFKIRPVAPLSEEEKLRAHDADELFIDMFMYYGISSLSIYKKVFGDNEKMHERHSYMLHHLSECPWPILEYTKAQLRPERLRAKSSHFIKT